MKEIQATGLYIAATTPHATACWAWLTTLSRDLTHMHAAGRFPARRSLVESAAFRQQARPGDREVYAAYRDALERMPPAHNEQAQLETFGPALDAYWLFQALERALHGEDVEQALAEAQAQTEAYVACYQARQQWLVCAQEVDLTYQGYGLVLDAAATGE